MAPALANKPAAEPTWQDLTNDSVLLRGDCLSLLPQLADNSVDCIWTDPPYLLSNGGTTCVAGRRADVDKGAWDQSHGITDDHRFNLEWLGECRRVLRPGGSLWVSGTVHVYLSVGMAMRELGLRILNDIVWEKPNPPPNLGCRCFTHATEIVLWATRMDSSNDRHVFNYALMRAENDGKQMKNVWRMPAPAKQEKSAGRHPTQKPLQLVDRCLRASTEAGATVLDPFCGSGTTGVAARQLGHRFIGMEREAEFVELAQTRLRATPLGEWSPEEEQQDG